MYHVEIPLSFLCMHSMTGGLIHILCVHAILYIFIIIMSTQKQVRQTRQLPDKYITQGIAISAIAIP